jgi:hypothetical protein
MPSVVGLSVSNLNIKRGILRTQIFLATHPPVFTDATNPLEVDSWLRTMESKFGLLHCIEYQKTLYASHQLRGAAGAWWACFIATLSANHHVPWGEFILYSAHITYLWVCSAPN